MMIVSAFFLSRYCNNSPENTNEPIDIVYIWVNGSDSKWRTEKEYYQNISATDSWFAVGEERFVEHDELKYSMRSVAQHIPWIRSIFIVTNGQIPSWLDENNQKVKIIKHSDIMPDSALPTFNSYAIEANLHNIPGLSNLFLFSNDDFYILEDLNRSYFFDRKGNPIIRTEHDSYHTRSIETSPFVRNVIYSAQVFEKLFHKHILFEPAHVTLPYRKDCYTDCAKAFSAEFNQTTHARFRSEPNIHRSIVAFFEIYKHKGIRIPEDSSASDILYLLIRSPEKLKKQISSRRPKLLCINDTPLVRDIDRENLPEFLELMFPQRASWEKQDF